MAERPWQPVDTAPQLGAFAIHVWLLESAAQERLGSGSGPGPPERKRRWRALTRASLLRLLAAYTGLSPNEIEIGRDPGGRPVLAGESRRLAPALDFSVSHSRGLALLAFGRDVTVGVDVEWPRDSLPVVRLARRLWGEHAAAQLAALEPPARAEAFAVAWSRHEARLKIRGAGAMPAGARRVPLLVDLATGDAAAAAVAVSRPPSQLLTLTPALTGAAEYAGDEAIAGRIGGLAQKTATAW